MISKTVILIRIALANIFSSVLNLLVGLVLVLGAAVLVIGGSVASTLDEALSKSIVGSITGHMQVYGARSKDPLEVYGRVDGSDSNLTPIDDFKKLKADLLKVPNVKRVVPMGSATSLIGSGNTVDVTLEKMRALVREQQNGSAPSPEGGATAQRSPEDYARRMKSLQGHVRNMVTVLLKDIEREKELVAETELDQASREFLARINTDEYWADFDSDPLTKLEQLENKLAPIVTDADLLFIRYLGTDLDVYQETFDRMTIAEGGKVPTGHRGILLPRFFYEEYLKLKNARRLDKIRDARAAGRTLADQTDKELQRFVHENTTQTREIVLQLDGIATAEAVKKLQGFLKEEKEADLAALLSKFFAVTDDNFDVRYKFFYDEMAPMLSMYRVKVGDTMTLRSFGRSGSLQTALVKVYGIFELKGLEKSPLAGANALVDMITFRELYGYLTAEKKAELDKMKAETGAKEISRENAEADLFGGDTEVVTETKASAIDDTLGGKDGPSAKTRRLGETFTPEEIDDGMVLHAAIVLADGSEAAQKRALDDVEKLLSTSAPKTDTAKVDEMKKLLAEGKLAFPLQASLQAVTDLEGTRASGTFKPEAASLLALQEALKAERANLDPAIVSSIDAFIVSARPQTYAVSWTSAAGFLGKFIDFFRVLLGVIVVIFVFIALVVVTIGMTIATLQRTSTIGTMRAIGAQRGFVMMMVLIETVMLALTFGTIGALLGSAVVKWLNVRGIPAFRDELYFFFSGPVLRPELTTSGLITAISSTLIVSVLAVILPLVLATRVAPITAMQSSES
ncbi:MAG: FtsX-like permease family protein [Archangium sp.]|nr:FtsX-like permease family protein [Archangium sp.]